MGEHKTNALAVLAAHHPIPIEHVLIPFNHSQHKAHMTQCKRSRPVTMLGVYRCGFGHENVDPGLVWEGGRHRDDSV